MLMKPGGKDEWRWEEGWLLVFCRRRRRRRTRRRKRKRRRRRRQDGWAGGRLQRRGRWSRLLLEKK